MSYNYHKFVESQNGEDTMPMTYSLRSGDHQTQERKNAVILPNIIRIGDPDLADFVGDKPGLSQEAAKTKADMIVFAGVHFMAETAKMLSPQKVGSCLTSNAGCSPADSCPSLCIFQ
ncbi:hypothetical protein MASR1M65_21380 [Saprospiraceae bacterium]